ncbi:MAG: hypothetical protein ACRYFZ_02195 [Janthinobacterium lividum]
MKPHTLLGAALLGLVLGGSALAQTTPTRATRAPSTGLPSASPPSATVPANATTPTDAEGAIYSNSNGVPARNVTGGTQRADQPRVGTMPPAVSGSQQSHRIHKGRPSSKNQPAY